jgi:hypothetical protein
MRQRIKQPVDIDLIDILAPLLHGGRSLAVVCNARSMVLLTRYITPLLYYAISRGEVCCYRTQRLGFDETLRNRKSLW